MHGYAVRRVVTAIPVLIGVTMVTFALAVLMPGDPARVATGQYATPDQVEAVRKRLGLDQPLPVQYARYMKRLLQGDLGTSLTTRQDVLQELKQFFPATLELATVAMTAAVVIGIALGVVTGAGRSPWMNSAVLLLSYIGVGLPEFWLGLMFQKIFGGVFGILPLEGRLSAQFSPPPPVTHMYTVDSILAGEWAMFRDAVWHLILPATTLAFARVASIARITHASMVSVMRRDYIRTARGKGLGERTVLTVHALRNALIPTATMMGMEFGWLLGGTILVENIFTWGGLGTYAWWGIFTLNLPVVMGVTLVITLVFMTLNLLTDLAYKFIDPRIVFE